MTTPTVKTRFAPSPTGLLHLGNARTALFSGLYALRSGGVFLLRVEDTDRSRSEEQYTEALQEDLRWLGLEWQEGPGADDAHGPYLQSQRDGVYARYFDLLERAGLAYPCFCSERELELARKAQLSAGRPPRYAGSCARLSATEVDARRARGDAATLRFRVPAGGQADFGDVVRGPQHFATDDIGDFIIRRGDGTPAFFFCNAIDDALMGVTHVLRGEDHLTNTPRQILLLEALGLPVPHYGHISLIVGADGAPLSKRTGSRSLKDLRDAGYLPGAVCNHLARLGHHYEDPRYVSLEGLARGFELVHLGRAPARHDEAQLLHWQREAVAHLDLEGFRDWAGDEAWELVPEDKAAAFFETVRPNVTQPHHVVHWARVLFTDGIERTRHAEEAIAAQTPGFYRVAVTSLADAPDVKTWLDSIKTHTGAKGKNLFQPLRAALTGELDGPELARVMELLPRERVVKRLVEFT